MWLKASTRSSSTCVTGYHYSPRNFTRQTFTALCRSGTTARVNTSDIQVLVSVPRPPVHFSFWMSLINIIKQISITSELIWIYRWNLLLQRMKTEYVFTLYSIKLNMASISGTGNIQLHSTRPMCYKATVVWHCWHEHKFFLVCLPNRVPVPCRSLTNLTGENQVVLGLVYLAGHWITAIFFDTSCKELFV